MHSDCPNTYNTFVDNRLFNRKGMRKGSEEEGGGNNRRKGRGRRNEQGKRGRGRDDLGRNRMRTIAEK